MPTFTLPCDGGVPVLCARRPSPFLIGGSHDRDHDHDRDRDRCQRRTV